MSKSLHVIAWHVQWLQNADKSSVKFLDSDPLESSL